MYISTNIWILLALVIVSFAFGYYRGVKQRKGENER